MRWEGPGSGFESSSTAGGVWQSGIFKTHLLREFENMNRTYLCLVFQNTMCFFGKLALGSLAVLFEAVSFCGHVALGISGSPRLSGVLKAVILENMTLVFW